VRCQDGPHLVIVPLVVVLFLLFELRDRRHAGLRQPLE
jgi:hypothetical protein